MEKEDVGKNRLAKLVLNCSSGTHAVLEFECSDSSEGWGQG